MFAATFVTRWQTKNKKPDIISKYSHKNQSNPFHDRYRVEIEKICPSPPGCLRKPASIMEQHLPRCKPQEFCLENSFTPAGTQPFVVVVVNLRCSVIPARNSNETTGQTISGLRWDGCERKKKAIHSKTRDTNRMLFWYSVKKGGNVEMKIGFHFYNCSWELNGFLSRVTHSC